MKQILLELSIVFILLFNIFLVLFLGGAVSEFIYIDF